MARKAEISFREYEHNFGKVAEGGGRRSYFIFENKGTANLIVLSATTSADVLFQNIIQNQYLPEQAEILKLFLTLPEETGCKPKQLQLSQMLQNRLYY